MNNLNLDLRNDPGAQFRRRSLLGEDNGRNNQGFRLRALTEGTNAADEASKAAQRNGKDEPDDGPSCSISKHYGTREYDTVVFKSNYADPTILRAHVVHCKVGAVDSIAEVPSETVCL